MNKSKSATKNTRKPHDAPVRNTLIDERSKGKDNGRDRNLDPGTRAEQVRPRQAPRTPAK